MNELDKWSNVHDDFVTIREFLDHICNNGYAIHEHYDVDDSFNPPQILQPVFEHERMKLIEKFFDIDAEKLEQERRALLENMKNGLSQMFSL
jgi:hypothetical protein